MSDETMLVVKVFLCSICMHICYEMIYAPSIDVCLHAVHSATLDRAILYSPHLLHDKKHCATSTLLGTRVMTAD